MNNLEVIIGIENHVELKTKSKMFGFGEVGFGEKPNTNVSEVDLGLPGTLPTVNKKGVELAIIMCNALNMQIDRLLTFDRKSYFYPDLVKGFQITQQFNPIGREGYIFIDVNGKNEKIEIERLHIEEDTAKQIHKDNFSLIDYNRSGIGLVEIVSKPFLRNSDQAVAYVEKIRELLLFLGVSDAKMSEGSLRCDINISLRPIGYNGFGNKVEIKNLNSLNNIKKAIDFEIKRQTKLIFSGMEVNQETRRFDESTQETILMRSKSSALNYNYFREPNIFPIKLDSKWVKSVIDSSPETADIKRKRYIDEYKLSETNVSWILSDIEICNYFEDVLSENKDIQKIVNYLMSDVKSYLNNHNLLISNTKLKSSDLALIIKYQNDGIISSKHAKGLILEKLSSDNDIDEIMNNLNLKLITDKKLITELINKIAQDNLELIKEQYSSRPERVEKTIMGKLMQETSGNVSPDLAKEIMFDIIKKIK